MSSAAENTNVCRIVRFMGHVQGVGFRYTTREIASRFAVRGYVHNMPDRSVELVVEGTPSEIDAFIRAIREQMVDFIREMTSSERPATNQFEGFTVRH